jgi:hypothetical protein
LDCSPSQAKQQELFGRIVDFVSQTSGLNGTQTSSDCFRVEQSVDKKWIEIHQNDLEDVLFRSDTEGRDFIQVNFTSNKKVLITDKLIGFKPAPLNGLDLAKLPKVVTTPDLMSVFEAIQETLHISDAGSEEVVVLKRVFEAIIVGGDSIGFDLSTERTWVKRIPTTIAKVSA